MWLALAACNTAPAEPEMLATALPSPPPAPKVERAPTGVPHGGFITHLAITDEGDAAVSVDTVGGLRLWTTLDGTREPVAFSVNGAENLAIAHVGDELLVAVLDQAGAVQLLRFSRLGTLRGRTQVPGETQISQVVAVGRGILVAREDGSIERYDAAGTQHGRIAVEPGEHVGALAVRRGAAAVLIGQRTTETKLADPPLEEIDRPARRAKITVATERASALRWITLGDELAWGASLALPDHVDDRVLALSPSGRRIAFVTDASQLEVYDTAPKLAQVEGPMMTARALSLGFVDDDHVVAIASATQWWTATKAPPLKPSAELWVADTTLHEEGVNSDGGAFGGDHLIAGLGADLVIQSAREVHYLGWRDTAAGNVFVAGDHVGLETQNRRIVWLDRALARESDTDLEELGYDTSTAAWWIDPNHAVVRKGGDKVTVDLVDLRHKDVHVSLGTFTYLRQVEMIRSRNEIALYDDGAVRRFVVDLEHDTVRELAALAISPSTSYVRLLDPAKADGVVALTVGYDDDGQRVTVFRDGDGKKIVGKKLKALTGSLAGIGRDGTLYLRAGGAISAWKNGREVLKWPEGVDADSVTPDIAGQHLLAIHGAAVTLYELDGRVVWTQNVWGAQTASFTLDGQIVLRTSGGLLALDAATGARMAAACGFSFGLMTKTPRVNALNVQPVCEDLGS